MDYYSILGVDPSASAAQILEAYNYKRAELIGGEESDPDFDIHLKQLDEAYIQLTERNKNTTLAPVNPLAVNQPPPGMNNNPILGMVDSLDAPIQVASEKVDYQPCPYCGNPNPAQAMVCSSCGKQISRPCPNCGKIVMLGQRVCPRCNTLIREHDQIRLSEGMQSQQQIQEERQANAVRVEALENGHTKRAGFGCLLWSAIIMGIIIVCGVGVYAIYFFGYLSQR
jgi:hypothetical protein